jgi:hypothetical protein
MIYRMINTRRTPAARRTIAAITLLLMPVLIALSVLLGLLYHTVEGLNELYTDLRDLFTEIVPEYTTDLARVIRDGGPA